jgi:hypothetical protein
VRPIATQYAVTDAEVGAVVEPLLASCAEASSGVPFEDLSTDRALAGDAYAIGSMLKTIQRSTKFIKLRITLESKERINLVEIQSTVNKEIAGRIHTVLFLQVVEELRQYCSL